MLLLGNGVFKDKVMNRDCMPGKVKTPRSFFSRLLVSEYFILYLNILLALIVLPFIPGLFSFANLSNIFEFIWPLLVLTIGQTFVLIVAGIDLSQTSIMGMVSVVGGFIMSSSLDGDKFSNSILWGHGISEAGGFLGGSHLAVPVAIIIMLATGAFIGWLNGSIIARLGMPPFMVTLVTQMFFLALAILLTQSNNIVKLPDSFNRIGDGKIAGILPIACLISVVLAVLAHLLLKKTLLGRWLYATGSNFKASHISGIPTNKVIIFAYMFSGFCAAIASIIYSGRLQMGRSTLGQSLLMDVVGAAIIGGNSLFGGKGKVTWSFFGVLFLILITNIMNLMNLDVTLIDVLKGLIILVAAFLDVIRVRILAK